MSDPLTPRQRETYEAVNEYRKRHGGGIQAACKALGLNSATYGNACRRLRFGTQARWSRGSSNRVVGGNGVASDREAFEFNDDDLPF